MLLGYSGLKYFAEVGNLVSHSRFSMTRACCTLAYIMLISDYSAENLLGVLSL